MRLFCGVLHGFTVSDELLVGFRMQELGLRI